jgi:hypothetical protein
MPSSCRCVHLAFSQSLPPPDRYRQSRRFEMILRPPSRRRAAARSVRRRKPPRSNAGGRPPQPVGARIEWGPQRKRDSHSHHPPKPHGPELKAGQTEQSIFRSICPDRTPTTNAGPSLARDHVTAGNFGLSIDNRTPFPWNRGRASEPGSSGGLPACSPTTTRRLLHLQAPQASPAPVAAPRLSHEQLRCLRFRLDPTPTLRPRHDRQPPSLNKAQRVQFVQPRQVHAP